ncbi:transposase [Streptomyces sp. NBC_00868]
MWVRDHLGGLWRDEDFADWYPRDGRPGLSPAQLATVCALQFLLGLSDRQAAEAVRCRIDLKYALDQDPCHRRRRRPAAGAGRRAWGGSLSGPRVQALRRSWCRTATATGPAVCAGAPPRTAGCRPRPSQSSRPTTRRPATRAADMSPVGRGSSHISPRPVIPTTS